MAQPQKFSSDTSEVILNNAIANLNAKSRKSLDAIFSDPPRADVRWIDIENLMITFGANVTEGRGSRVKVKLNGQRAVFHRPHPKPNIEKGVLKAVRGFLQDAGYSPEG